MDGWHETEVRVRYFETDQMGIVHNANYLVWFEVGRSELCRDKGFSYKQMEDEENALMVVAESYCRYKSPAHYEDILTVRTKIGEIRSRSLRFYLRDLSCVGRDTDRRRRNAAPGNGSGSQGPHSPRGLQETTS